MSAIENLEQLRRLFKECAEDKNYVWQTSYKATRNEGFSARNNFICQFQKEIEDLAGDVLDLCKDLIDANKDLMYEVSYEDVVSSVKNRQEWHQTFSLFVFYCSKIKQYEKDERDGKCRYYFKDESTLPFLNFSDLLYERKENGRIDSGTVNRSSEDYKIIFDYASSKYTFEYKLCSLLSDYVHEKGGMGPIKSNVLECLASTVCLYTALKNEKVKLYRQNGYFPDTKTQGAKASTKAKKTKQPREVFTERAKKYFEKAEEAGYLKKVGNTYEWTYRGGVVALVYFFIRIYEPKSPPFKQLQPLFGVEGLTSSRRNLEQTDWYKDERTREAMTPEELAHERRERKLKLKEPKEWFPELKRFFED